MFVRIPRYFRLDGISTDRHDNVIPDEDTITTEKEAEQWLLVQFERREAVWSASSRYA